MNFQWTCIYCENLRVNQLLKVTFGGVVVAQTRLTVHQLLKVTFSGVVVAQTRVTELNLMQF